ncbi:MAG TPA: hypothetical protein VLE20_08965 [Blastocatellia bacterium]|nr:hypothetical protein [Blastocatellia bacterium]
MLIAALAVHAVAFGNDPYRDGIAKFRVEREAELKAEDGWLSVSGFVLAQGRREAFRR